MLNQILLVGRIVSIEDFGVVLSISRSYKNSEGIYELDTIPVKIPDGMQTNVTEYCRKGDIVGIKGRIESEGVAINIVADKITFLSSKDNLEGGD